MTIYRALRTAQVQLTRTFYLDEQPVDSSSSVTVSLTRLDGTAVITNGATTGPDANHLYTYTYSGSDVLDALIVSWSATIGGDPIVLDQDLLEICGGFYFSLAEGRAVDDVLVNTTKYPTSALIEARIDVEDEAESLCGQAFVPRFMREVVSGDGGPVIRLAWPHLRKIRRIQVANTFGGQYVDLTADELATIPLTDTGVLRRDLGIFWPSTAIVAGYWPNGRSNVIVEYEHGLDRPPRDVVRGAKIRFKSILQQPKSKVPDRAERIAISEMGVVSLASPSRDGTGISEVDGAYGRNPSPVPGFG